MRHGEPDGGYLKVNRMPDDRVADRVSADMERIFRRHAPADATQAERTANERSRAFVVHAVPAIPAPSRFVRLVTIGIPLLAVAVVAFLFLQIGADRRPGASVAQAGAAKRPIAAAPARPAPVAYRATAPLVADDAIADAAMPVPVDEGGDEGRDARRDAPLAASVRRPRATGQTAGQAGRATGRAMAATAAPASAADRDCRPGSQENHCIYREVREADRRLVAAYHAAADAGVPRREMLAVRRVWTRALAVSLDDPDGTIRTYDELARRLRDAARAARTDDDLT